MIWLYLWLQREITKGANKMSFIIQYLLHPRSVGAVKPSSRHLAIKMVEDVDFHTAECIVEIGAGTGIFTEEVVKAKRKGTKFLIFEINDSFYKMLKKKYGRLPNVRVIHDTAGNMGEYMKKYGIHKADYIISGLPFASLPKESSDKILKTCRKCLAREGAFITFQYTKCKIPLFCRFFPAISIKKENRNIPPAYILNCKKVRKNPGCKI